MAPFKPLLTATVEAAINQCLALAGDSGPLLRPLAGKVVAITVRPVGGTWHLRFGPGRVQVLAAHPGPADVHISGTPWALGLMGVSARPTGALFSGRVRMDGDIALGQALRSLLKQLNAGLAPRLARGGGRLGGRLLALARNGQSAGASALETLRLNTVEFLQEEAAALPPAGELAIFYRHVDDLRSDYDRLRCRVDRLCAFARP